MAIRTGNTNDASEDGFNHWERGRPRPHLSAKRENDPRANVRLRTRMSRSQFPEIKTPRFSFLVYRDPQRKFS